VDLILSCGDLKADYLAFLVTMIPAPLFYVHGNHDKSYKYHPPQGCECIDGRLATFRGVRILGLGGCKAFQPDEHQYTEHQMWQRVKKLAPGIRKAGGVDILVSHAPAIGLGDGPDAFHRGFEALRYLDEEFQPQIHLFGHRHMSGSPVAHENVFTFGRTSMINATGYRLIDVRQ